MSSNYSALAQLPDDQLLAEVTRLATCERQATTHLVASLAVLDERRLYLREGYASLFSYCTKALRLSEDAAYFRIEAARAARRFPLILERLSGGDISLTAVRLLAPHLTRDNYVALLDAACGKSKREVEELIVRLRPRSDAASSVRKLPTRQTAYATIAPPALATTETPSLASPPPASSVAASDDRPVSAALAGLLSSTPAVEIAPAMAAPPTVDASTFAPPAVAPIASRPSRALVTPLAPERYKVQMTVSTETYARLRRAQALLRHAIPDGDPAAIFDRALTLLVTQLERRKWGARTERKLARRCDGAGAVSAKAGGRSPARTVGADGPRGALAVARTAPSRSPATGTTRSVSATSDMPGSPVSGKPSTRRVSAAQLVPARLRPADQVGEAPKAQMPKAETQRSGTGTHRRPQRGSRRIPAAVRRVVWQREGGRCGYVGVSGNRCEATSYLEFHHVVPQSEGGQATVDGLRLLCAAHHALETKRWFGEIPPRHRTRPRPQAEDPVAENES
jgi:5-methylcytosine-specific restriction endonuclease McrA